MPFFVTLSGSLPSLTVHPTLLSKHDWHQSEELVKNVNATRGGRCMQSSCIWLSADFSWMLALAAALARKICREHAERSSDRKGSSEIIYLL